MYSSHFFGNTVQLYTTSKCGMGCPHCSSRLQEMPDMPLGTFRTVVNSLEAYGVSRLEFFANDPILHPEILEQINVLAQSKLQYALLTVGRNPHSEDNEWRFMEVINKMTHNRLRGGVVFSVDFLEGTAKTILAGAVNDLTPYAFKADTFYSLVPVLGLKEIPVRTNTVISVKNVSEVPEIVRRVIKNGFAASVCFVQTVQPEFLELSADGFTKQSETGFRDFLYTSGLLSDFQADQIVKESYEIVARGELQNSVGPFNKFRGFNPQEADIPERDLVQLKEKLLCLKSGLEERFLPEKDYIHSFGHRGVGCLGLLQQGKFPQIKVGPLGEMRFCCDMHDKYTASYSIERFYEPENREAFLRLVRTNPYIWLCLFFNPCSFSVNYVNYATAKK